MSRKTLRILFAFAIALIVGRSIGLADPVGPSPVKVPPGLVGIQTLSLSKDHTKLSGVITSTSPKLIAVGYKFSQWNGSTWVEVKKGATSVAVNNSSTLSIPIKQGSKEQRFRLEATVPSPNVTRSKEVSISPLVKFVVRYDTSGNRADGHWVLVGVFNNDNTDPAQITTKASHRAKNMETNFGFQTQRRTKNTLSFFGGQEFRVSVFVRTNKPIERLFDTKKEAVAFHDALRKAIPSSELTVEDVRKK